MQPRHCNTKALTIVPFPLFLPTCQQQESGVLCAHTAIGQPLATFTMPAKSTTDSIYLAATTAAPGATMSWRWTWVRLYSNTDEALTHRTRLC